MSFYLELHIIDKITIIYKGRGPNDADSICPDTNNVGAHVEPLMQCHSYHTRQHNIDITVQSKTQISVSCSHHDLDYTLYWSAKPKGERNARVGFAIQRDIVTKLGEMLQLVSDRSMTIRIPLTRDRNATIVSILYHEMQLQRRASICHMH